VIAMLQNTRFDIHGAYKRSFTTGAITGIAAGTATAGHLLAMRWADAAKTARLRSIELEFLLTTAFGAAQEVGFDVYRLTGYSAAHTGATALDFTGANNKKRVGAVDSIMTGRIANAGALTAGTHTLDTDALARMSVWAGAIGAQMAARYFDFTNTEPGGLYLANNMGLLLRNVIAWGATGVGKVHATVEWDEGILYNP
jgi:hypothetical protein